MGGRRELRKGGMAEGNGREEKEGGLGRREGGISERGKGKE